MRMVWLALLSACTFAPQSSGSRDGAPHDAAVSDGARADAGADASQLPDAQPGDAPMPTGCPAGYVRIGQLTSLYKVYDWTRDSRGSTAAQATQLCTGPKTHLAVLNSAQEATALGAAIAVNPRSPYFWNGITDAATEGMWLTMAGAAVSFLPWAQGEPGGGTNSNCALTLGGNLYDWPCGARYPFACECENP